MDTFYDALVSQNTLKIPGEYDWFAPLIGDWDFDYYDGYDKEKPRYVKGEWIFRYVLEGAGIEDIFICPSRTTRETNPQPDGEYGLAVRMFHPEKKCYDMVYTCAGHMTRLEFRKEQDKLVGTKLDCPVAKWVFSEITADTFHWQNVTVLENGGWRINADVYGKRRPEWKNVIGAKTAD